jgi:hypothetical protein
LEGGSDLDAEESWPCGERWDSSTGVWRTRSGATFAIVEQHQ